MPFPSGIARKTFARERLGQSSAPLESDPEPELPEPGPELSGSGSSASESTDPGPELSGPDPEPLRADGPLLSSSASPSPSSSAVGGAAVSWKRSSVADAGGCSRGSSRAADGGGSAR